MADVETAKIEANWSETNAKEMIENEKREREKKIENKIKWQQKERYGVCVSMYTNCVLL